MLCPEVWNFPPPKVMCTEKRNQSLESVMKTINMNYFYKSIIITCPDQLQTPSSMVEAIEEDSDYYKVTNCPLTEFIEPMFIEKFVKNGNLYCTTVNKNCIIDNCASITPDGILTLHIIEFIYQTLGFEGTKRPNNFYEVRIDLKYFKQNDKIKSGLQKLEVLDFHILWEPHSDNICPSSIAKYLDERNINVSLQTSCSRKILPTVKEIPSPKDNELEDMVEWIGLLSHEADISPTEGYISTYRQPESDYPIKSSLISIYIVHSLITPTRLKNVCNTISEYVSSRELENYWASISVQSYEHSLWQWGFSSPKMFQAHDSSCNVFFEQKDCSVFSIGQLKYS